VVDAIDDAIEHIEGAHGARPLVWATSARASGVRQLSFGDASGKLRRGGVPTLVVFGTGHGLTDEVIAKADATLAPIRPDAMFNHLSVRAAAAICLDRLIGDSVDTNLALEDQ